MIADYIPIEISVKAHDKRTVTGLLQERKNLLDAIADIENKRSKERARPYKLKHLRYDKVEKKHVSDTSTYVVDFKKIYL